MLSEELKMRVLEIIKATKSLSLGSLGMYQLLIIKLTFLLENDNFNVS